VKTGTRQIRWEERNERESKQAREGGIGEEGMEGGGSNSYKLF